jgi:hypothetical protein
MKTSPGESGEKGKVKKYFRDRQQMVKHREQQEHTATATASASANA